MPGSDRLTVDEIWGDKNWNVSALGWSVDGDAEGDLGREFGLFSPVGVHWR